MRRLSRVAAATSAVVAVTVVVASCGSASSPSTSPPPAAPATVSSPSPAPAASAGAGTTVSANTASQAEIAAALQAAGVTNADRWAKEVVEYRPYPLGDIRFTRLREELAKYNPDPAAVDAILSVLWP